MSRALTLLLPALLAFALPSGFAQAGPAHHKASSAPPRRPDLTGYWSNSTLTPLIRPPKFGDRLVHTPQEVVAIERAEAAGVEEGNRPTPVDAPVNTANGLESRPDFVAAGGDVGGYNRGWLDPGSMVMRVDGQPRTSILTSKDGKPPRRKDGAPPGRPPFLGGLGSFDNPEDRMLGERCIIGFGRNAGPPMLSNGFYNNNYHIVQTPDAVAIEVEMVHDVRIIRLHGKHRDDGIRPWFGDSIGWWEGSTLVVETTQIPESQAFMGSWKNLTVIERFTPVAMGRLRYQFQISDPGAWDEPWGGEYEFATLRGVVYEYACHEGNYALPGMLAGARAEEQARAKSAPATVSEGRK